MWVARDKDSKIHVFKEKPVRVSIKTDKLNVEDKEFWDEEAVFDGYDKWIYPEDYFEIDSSLFPNLKWEDEPLEVELKVKSKPKKIGTYGWQEECDRCQN